jgi:hypothetical protein
MSLAKLTNEARARLLTRITVEFGASRVRCFKFDQIHILAAISGNTWTSRVCLCLGLFLCAAVDDEVRFLAFELRHDDSILPRITPAERRRGNL